MALLYRREPHPQHKKYKDYKCYLREDFVYRCVYCTIHENEFGGPRSYHVEHFRPKGVERFAHLITDYGNLLYACQVCNPFKGDAWPSDNPIEDGKGFIDPCEYDYDEHFRLADGDELVGLSGVGRYMVERLHLNRMQLIKLRRKRQGDEVAQQEALALIDETLDLVGLALSNSNISLEQRNKLEGKRVALQMQRATHIARWAKRGEPLYDLDDYR